MWGDSRSPKQPIKFINQKSPLRNVGGIRKVKTTEKNQLVILVTSSFIMIVGVLILVAGNHKLISNVIGVTFIGALYVINVLLVYKQLTPKKEENQPQAIEQNETITQEKETKPEDVKGNVSLGVTLGFLRPLGDTIGDTTKMTEKENQKVEELWEQNKKNEKRRLMNVCQRYYSFLGEFKDETSTIIYQTILYYGKISSNKLFEGEKLLKSKSTLEKYYLVQELIEKIPAQVIETISENIKFGLNSYYEQKKQYEEEWKKENILEGEFLEIAKEILTDPNSAYIATGMIITGILSNELGQTGFRGGI